MRHMQMDVSRHPQAGAPYAGHRKNRPAHQLAGAYKVACLIHSDRAKKQPPHGLGGICRYDAPYSARRRLARLVRKLVE
jgi:hypothetical protein